MPIKTKKKRKNMHTRTYRNIRGGKILGTGMSGCITYPAIKCKNNYKSKANTEYITKLYDPDNVEIVDENIMRKGDLYYRYDKKYFTEMEKANEIRKRISDIDKYIIMPIHECDINTANNNSNIEECITRIHAIPKKILWVEKAEGDLGDFIDLKPKFSKKDLVNAIATLTKGLKLLHANNITHNDIYEYNILYGYKNKALWFKLTDIELTLFDQDDFKGLEEDDNRNITRIIKRLITIFKLPDNIIEY